MTYSRYGDNNVKLLQLPTTPRYQASYGAKDHEQLLPVFL